MNPDIENQLGEKMADLLNVEQITLEMFLKHVLMT